MPRYHYTAMDGRGKEQKGRLEAENEQEAAAKLKQMGLFPTSMSEVRGRGGAKAAAPSFRSMAK